MASITDEKHIDEGRKEPGQISFTHLLRTISRYIPVILISLAAVAFVYVLVAVAIFISAPVQRTTSMSFRLDFDGADEQVYPNKLPFNAADIVSAPTLRRVYEANNLQRFVGFASFKNSVFILESNTALENIDREYQARLSDPKISAVDRQRLESEYALKRKSISHSEYSLNHAVMDRGNSLIPISLIDKILSDTLRLWAEDQLKNKGTFRYRISTPSSHSLRLSISEDTEPALALEVLRTKINDSLSVLDAFLQVPGAEVVRVPGKDLSSADIRGQLQDLIRFRIEPAKLALLNNGVVADRTLLAQFLDSQRSFFAGELEQARARVDAIREGLLIYTRNELPAAVNMTEDRTDSKGPRETRETVMPQLSDTFLDRLVSITSENADRVYRQKEVFELKRAVLESSPLEQEVEYYQAMATRVRTLPVSRTPTAQELAGWKPRISSITKDYASALENLDAIYNQLSETQNSSGNLFTVTGPPVRRVERTVSPKHLALNGLLTLLVALPVILALCFVHDRLRKEEQVAQA